MRTRFPPFRAMGVDLSDPRVREGFRISLEAMDLMKQKAETANVRFVVLGIPTKELVFKDEVYRSSNSVPAGYAGLVGNEERLWVMAREGLAARGIRFVEALPKLREMVDDGRQPYWESADGHPNSLGQRVIAEVVAEAVSR